MLKNEFRMWDHEGKKMYSPAWPTWNGRVETWLNNIPQNGFEQFSAYGPESLGTLMQKLDRKDKNGVFFHIGDLVRNKSGRVCEIYYNKKRGIIDCKIFKTTYKDNAHWFEYYLYHKLEIVGNIFEGILKL